MNKEFDCPIPKPRRINTLQYENVFLKDSNPIYENSQKERRVSIQNQDFGKESIQDVKPIPAPRKINKSPNCNEVIQDKIDKSQISNTYHENDNPKESSSANNYQNIEHLDQNSLPNMNIISNEQLHQAIIENFEESDNISLDNISLPMPAYPAPILQKESFYGKLNSAIGHPATERSQSWTFCNNYETNIKPLEQNYVNAEPDQTYGKLFETDSQKSVEILTPISSNINHSNFTQCKKGFSINKELLYEFDPLMKANIDYNETVKCNHLTLLENLLELDTYSRHPNFIEDSDEDNGNVESVSLPPLPDRYDSLPNVMQSNSTSMLENCADMTNNTDILDNKINDESFAGPTQSQTNWFLDIKDEETLPSYNEAIGYSTSDFIKTKECQPKQHQKASVKTIVSNVFKNKIDVLKKKTNFLNSRQSNSNVIVQMVPRPMLSVKLVRHEGHLIRLPSSSVEDILKEMQNRKAIIRDGQFQTFLDKDMKNQRESFGLDKIITIQHVSSHKFTNNSISMYCFEITVATCKNQPSYSSAGMSFSSSGSVRLQRYCHLYGVVKESERDVWMQKLIESMTHVFPTSFTCQYYRAGWGYLKSSISSPWGGTWFLLQKRERRLVFYNEVNMNLEEMDLRKARCIVLKENDESIKSLRVENGPLLMIDCPPYTIYLIMSLSRETKIWRHIVREVAHYNGPQLNEQQLTKYNVPVLIDKCINFIYIHGSLSEGIYRKSGSENLIQKLISNLRTDAFNVEITRNEYNEHDVANVLKRFLRDLPKRLLGQYSMSFISITELKSKQDKLNAYKELVQRLSQIEYHTLKKIIGHLSFIQSQKSKNKMSIQNLAVIWGPTLLQNKEEDMEYSQKQADVISDLIDLYKDIFQLSADEIIREKNMLTYLHKYYAISENTVSSQKQSGDIRIWISLDRNPNNMNEEKEQINVTLTPTKTAYDICKELSKHMKIAAHQLTLHEIILNDSLQRPIYHNEKVFDIVLSWSYWPEPDSKNNYLIVKPIKILKEIQSIAENFGCFTLSKNVKFTDNKSRSFRTFNIELQETNITVSKRDKNTTTLIKSIPLHNVKVYLGCEKKRDCQSKWAITLIENVNKIVLRTREIPFIGHVIAGDDLQDQILWFSGFWYKIYGKIVIPPH